MKGEYITFSNESKSPYSDIVSIENNLYLSGLIPVDPITGEIIKGDIDLETNVIMQNMSRILKENGSDMDKVIKVEIFLNDFSDKERMNEIYVKYFPKGKLPSRVCVGGVDLACGCKVEMVVQAHK